MRYAVVSRFDAQGHTNPKGFSMFQGGIRAYTLCQSCNNVTGANYADEYVKWARAWQEALATNDPNQANITLGLIGVSPLKFLKQSVVMMMSVRGQGTNGQFLIHNFELSRFALNPYSNELPPNYRFWLCLYPKAEGSATAFRHQPEAARVTVEYSSLGPIAVSTRNYYSEMAHPPFAIVMTSNGESFSGTTEITHFSKYDPRITANIELTLNIIRNSSSLAGGYLPLQT